MIRKPFLRIFFLLGYCAGACAQDIHMSDIMVSSPLDTTQSSVTSALMVGSSFGSAHTSISGNDNYQENSNSLSGAVAYLGLGYAYALPYHLYMSIEAFFDARSNEASRETPNESTSYAFRQKSAFGATAALGWRFGRDDTLYVKAGTISTKVERNGGQTADIGANFAKSYKDTSLQYGFGFLMPRSESSYLRYELAITPAYSTVENSFGESQFAYKLASSEFRFGWHYLLSPFTSTSDFASIHANGPYLAASIGQNNLAISQDTSINADDGSISRISSLSIPASTTMGGWALGYSTALASRNLYSAIEYTDAYRMRYSKSQNRVQSRLEDYYFTHYSRHTYSAILGVRPHLADLLFIRAGYIQSQFSKHVGVNQRLVNVDGGLLGLGFETALAKYTSLRGEYQMNRYSNATDKATSTLIKPTGQQFDLAIVLRP